LHRRRAHGFAPEEGTWFCTKGGHTTIGNGLTYFSYLLSVNANCLMKCLIEMLDRMLDEMLDKMLDEILSRPFKMHIDGLKITKITEIILTYIPKENEIKRREWMKEKNDKTMEASWTCPRIKKQLINKSMNAQL
jgi:hypothetical protein